MPKKWWKYVLQYCLGFLIGFESKFYFNICVQIENICAFLSALWLLTLQRDHSVMRSGVSSTFFFFSSLLPSWKLTLQLETKRKLKNCTAQSRGGTTQRYGGKSKPTKVQLCQSCNSCKTIYWKYVFFVTGTDFRKSFCIFQQSIISLLW